MLAPYKVRKQSQLTNLLFLKYGLFSFGKTRIKIEILVTTRAFVQISEKVGPKCKLQLED